MEEPKKAAETEHPSIWEELKEAGLGTFAKVALSIVFAYALVIAASLLSGLWKSHTAGQFGDAFGALTSAFNALAFAGIVATVVLQSRELRDSRKELAKQAKAQEAWAEAATKQIELTREIEEARMRPVIKAEWHHVDNKPDTIEYKVRNVGLGVAIISAVELRTRSESFGKLHSHSDPSQNSAWKKCIGACLTPGHKIKSHRLMQFDDLNRALAPNEPQALLVLKIVGDDTGAAVRQLREQFWPVIYFRSVRGVEYVSASQFNLPEEEEVPG
jgi:hypothetical protein